jgi:hypothetical protein
VVVAAIGREESICGEAGMVSMCMQGEGVKRSVKREYNGVEWMSKERIADAVPRGSSQQTEF